MYQVNGYEGRKKVFAARMAQIPRAGDGLCVDEKRYYRVAEVLWHIGGDGYADQRITINLEQYDKAKQGNVGGAPGCPALEG